MRLHKPFLSLFSQVRSFEPSARLFLMATVMDGIVFSAWMLFFNFYILGRGFDRQFLGMVNAMPSLGALLFGIPLGMLSDRLGRKRSMLLGVGCSILFMGMEVTVVQPVLILIAGFLAGLANILFYINQAPFMMKVSNPNNRVLLFSMNFGLLTLSGAVGNLFAGQLPSLFGTWLEVAPGSATAYQAVLLTAVSLSLVTLLPLSLIREPRVKMEDESQRPRAALWRTVMHPMTLKLAFPNMLIGFGAAILIPYMNVFFLDRFSLPDQKLGVLFSLSALLTGVGSVIGPRLSISLGGKIRAVVFTQTASLVFLLLIGFTPWFWLVAISFLLRGTLMNLAVPLYHAFAMERLPEREQGTANSVLELAWQIGWTVGPYLSGVVQQSYGFTPIFIATVVMYFFANVLTWIFFQRYDGILETTIPLDNQSALN